MQKPQENLFGNLMLLLCCDTHLGKLGFQVRKLPHSIGLWLSEEPKSAMRTDCHVLANVRAQCSLSQVKFCKADAVRRKVHARYSTV